MTRRSLSSAPVYPMHWLTVMPTSEAAAAEVVQQRQTGRTRAVERRTDAGDESGYSLRSPSFLRRNFFIDATTQPPVLIIKVQYITLNKWVNRKG